MTTQISRDTRLLFATRIVRLFAYGFLSLQLVLYLASIGIDERRIGLLLTLTLAGDVLISLYLSTRADAFGRRRTLIAGALLMVGAAAVFASTHNFVLLILAATIGVISPSGNEVGPFLPIEQVALTHVAPATDRTKLFAWYNLVGSFATASGSLVSGWVTELLMQRGHAPANSYRSVVISYGLLGIVLAIIFTQLTPSVEIETGDAPKTILRVEKSRSIVLRLSALFALDSFAGGLVVQSIVSYWFYVKFGLSPSFLGSIFFGANLLAGVSALLANRIANRIGLINTMVFTHLPSNVLLILVPLMPTLPLAISVLLLRFSISQMDVPTRQSYVIAVVDPSERTAAAGITGVARTAGAALAPILAMPLIAGSRNWVPFVAAGALKIVYDLGLLAGFRGHTE
ncbi:MAG: MFS transporter [Thermoanaerobaculia bacterium]